MEIDATNWSDFAAAQVDPAAWTAIVPAAGIGSRLGHNLPKILYPVAGRTVLDWLLDFLSGNCNRLVFVLSQAGRAPVEQALMTRIPNRYDIVVQETPTGMGDAVQLGLSMARTPQVVVVWGDQVALRKSSVEACMRIHRGSLAADVTCPTVWRAGPYIHFERDDSGRLSGVRQAREGDAMPEFGESDTGFFCFRRAALARLLSQLRSDRGQRGHKTGEFNLLPAIPLAVREGMTVVTPRLMEPEETMGINTRQDASDVEAFLMNLPSRLGIRFSDAGDASGMEGTEMAGRIDD